MMPNSRYIVNEVMFAGQYLHLLRSDKSRNHSSLLIKSPVKEATDASVARQLSHEYEICQDLDLAGILRPTAIETFEGRPALLFKDPGGTPLTQLLATDPLDLSLFLDVAVEIAKIIGRLHRKGIVHKDIHSGNIIVCTDHDPVRVYLTGLGIASLLPGQRAEKTAPQKLEGTLAVMSPEQTGRMNRPIDYRSDFYSLGAVFYQMLTAKLPFVSNDPLELVFSHLAVKPQAPNIIDANIPLVLSDLVLKLLAKDADDRYRSAAGIVADLKRCRDDWHRTGTISAFELARQDVSETFHIPDKLYGREEEIRTLQVAFERTCNGPLELVLVTGYAGIGKTELVNQIRRSVFQKDGYFIAGKCDPLDRKIPCAPFIEAVNDAIGQLLARPRERVDSVRKTWVQTLGDQGRVLTDVIPMLSLIIGEQPPVQQLPPEQASHRFHLMLQRLFSTVTLRGVSVVIFLDDLQWADFSTLKMLQTLACDTDLRNVLLIGAYRDEQVDENHGLARILNEIEAAGGRIHTLALGPMKTEAVSALTADALDRSPDGTADLAALCQEKTGGNPFFLRRFLLELVARKLIFFNTTRNAWQWRTDKITRTDVTDNVVELMAGTIAGLDDHVQQALKSAACIGSRFDLDTLCVANHRLPQTQLDDLWPAVQSGLISVSSTIGLRVTMGPDATTTRPVIADKNGTDKIVFSFIHDRIQEAAYSLMADNEKMGLHLRIGHLLLETCDYKQLTEKIFDILGQLNRAIPLITAFDEIVTLAELNLKAGQRARSLALFESAFDYFRVGIDLMAEKGWQHHYELTKELHLKGIESAFVSGRYSELDDWFEAAVDHIQSPIEVIDAYIVKIEKETTESNLLDATHTGLSILAQLGIKLPANPSEPDFKAELEKTEKLLHRFSIDDIYGLPKMEDPRYLAALNVMINILPSAIWVKRELHDIITFKALRLLLRHGNCRFSALIFCTYAFTINSILEKLEDVKNYGRLGMRFLERYQNARSDNRAKFLFYSLILPFSEQYQKTMNPLKSVHQSCMEIGQFVHAGTSLTFHEILRIFLGEELESVNGHAVEAMRVLKKIRHRNAQVVLNFHHQLVLNLMGKSKQIQELIGEAFDERIFLPRALQNSPKTLLSMVYINNLMLAYLFECFKGAVRLADKVENIYDLPKSATYISRQPLFCALSRLAMCETNAEPPDNALLDKVAVDQQRLQLLADAAPMNHLHLLHMVKAERARVEGHILKAQEHFDSAIALAEENGYLQDRAMANELTARFWMGGGKKPIARLYMQQALDCYTRWGAAAKVRHLQEKHPEFFIVTEAEAAAPEPMPQRRAADLDVMSALRASRAISGEIRLDRLVEKLMAVVIENAGATCSRLLLEADGRFYVAAEADAELPGQITRLEKAVAVDQAEHLLPLQLVQYVQRTGNSLVIEDAPSHELFGQDPYIVKNRPRSVLCSPIVRKEKVIGLFYLENNLAAEAFTDERLKMLEILSAQIAVSLENAHLYEARRRAEAALEKHRDHLEDLVKARTIELEIANTELADAKDQAEAANEAKSTFLANMSHELRNPLTPILGYTEIMQRDPALLSKHRKYLNTINRSGEHLLDLINGVLEISKIEAGRTTLESHTFNLRALFQDLEVIFRPATDAKSLSFEVIGIDDLPRQATTDEKKLRQVMVNLLGNAIKFTDQGGITVRAVIKDEKDCAMCLAVDVADTGVGIAENELEKVFGYFEQVAGGRAQKGGAGLGLAISRNFVRIMGGDITVTSEKDKGSQFCFEIKLQNKRVSDVETTTVQKRRVISLATGYEVPRVLVVEDTNSSRELLVKLLTAVGFQVEAAVNGKEAVDLFHKWRPDFIWMDVRMPVMDGLEATRRIKTTEEGQSTIVTALTAHALEEEKEKILAAGCDDFVRKPFREREIFEVMAKHLGLEYMYEELAEEAGATETGIGNRTEQLAAQSPPNFVGRRVLVVEDSELNRDVAVALLEEIGLTVETAENGQLAVDKLTGSAPGIYDAVLMDIQMPLMDGYEATQNIRMWEAKAQLTDHRIPIIALTAHALKGEIEKCLANDMDDYLPKPVDEQELHRVLLRWITPRQ